MTSETRCRSETRDSTWLFYRPIDRPRQSRPAALPRIAGMRRRTNRLDVMLEDGIRGNRSERNRSIVPELAIREELGTEPTRPAVEEDPGALQLAEPKDSVGSAVSAGLASPERRRGVRGRRHGLVDRDHPRLEPTCQRPGDSPLPAPDARSQSELAGVGRGHRRCRGRPPHAPASPGRMPPRALPRARASRPSSTVGA